MTCYHPLIRRIHVGEYLTAKDGHKYPKADIISTQEYEWYQKYNAKYEYEKIPCGKCIGCRLEYSKNWATRCMLESKLHYQNWFITLTYDEEHLPIDPEKVNTDTGEIFERNETWNGTLRPKDLQNFMKRLRITWERKYNNKDIRFFACGEYGSQYKRPHYHLIVFNLNLTEEQLKPKFINEEHQQIYECPEIEKIWGKGLIAIGGVSWSSCAYVARYITKKQKGPDSVDYYYKQGQEPEFVRMSRKPGIGREYYELKKHEIYETDEIFQTTVKGNTVKLKPPRYYDKLYDIDYPEDMERIKNARRASAKKALKVKKSKTTLKEHQQLEAEEKTQLIKSKMLIRGLESSI